MRPLSLALLLAAAGCTVDATGLRTAPAPAPGSPVTAAPDGALSLDRTRVPVLEPGASCPEGQAVVREGEGWACAAPDALPEHDHGDRYVTPADLAARVPEGALPWTDLADPAEAGCPGGGVPRRNGADDGWECAAFDPGALLEAELAALAVALGDDVPATAPVAWAGVTGVPEEWADGDDDLLASLGCGQPGQVPKRTEEGWACGEDADTRYSGADFAPGGQRCAEAGTFVTGVDLGGDLVCAAPEPDLGDLPGRLDGVEDDLDGLCAIACDGRDCGEDGCGGSCGDCAAWEECRGGRCEPAVAVRQGWVLVPPGTFTMGSPDGEPGRDEDETQHQVTLTRAFLLKATEVTQGEWRALMGGNPSRFSACGDRCPVEQVSRADAAGFCNALSRAHGLEECYQVDGDDIGWPDGLDCEGYRLPTEAEWEYAARAGAEGAVPGERPFVIVGEAHAEALHPLGWYAGNSGVTHAGGEDCSDWAETQHPATSCGTHPVALKRPNAWGLYDVVGNVWEWVWDLQAPYAGDAVDPTGPGVGSGCTRGGSWSTLADRCRSAARGRADTRTIWNALGLRPARTVP